MNPLLLELEEAVVAAWPAEESSQLGGWLLRSSGGPTRRGNSVATLDGGAAAQGSASLGARIESAERWYAERGRPAQFHVGPCSPVDLDAELAARGYHTDGSSVCAVAPTSGSAPLRGRGLSGDSAGRGSELRARVDTSPTTAWLGLVARASRFADTQQVFLGFLARIGPRARFVSVELPSGELAAVCLGITSEGRWGVYSMLTLPTLRRQGAGRAALAALAQSAAEAGAGELYLLVERDNVGARSLYAQSGFRDVYDYHYRVPGLS